MCGKPGMAPTCTADAAIVHLKDLLLGFHHQGIINANLPKFILNHRDAATMVACRARTPTVNMQGIGRAQAQPPTIPFRIWLTRVVFPAPRKPVTTVIGTLLFAIWTRLL
jgi:hypothetical protein